MIRRARLGMNVSLLLFAVFVILTGSLSVASARTIGVVYDDSGSMAGAGRDGNPPYDHRFAYASYSLQTLRALLGDRDKLIVGFMNDSVYVSTTDSKRDIGILESRSHPKNPTGQKRANTPYGAVSHVMQLLQEEKAVDDRWLIIISDGHFEPEGIPADLHQHITEFQQKVPGAKIICLGIASGAGNPVFEAWRDYAGASILTSPPSRTISERMQQIAAMVTAGTTGSGIRPDVSGDRLTFTPPFPLKRFTVLQQASSPEDLAEVKQVTTAQGKMKLGQVSQTATPAVDTSKGSFSAIHGSVIQVTPEAGTVTPAGSPVSITLSRAISRKASIVLLPEVSVQLKVSLYDEKGSPLQHDGSRLFYACPGRPVTVKAVLDFGAGAGNAKEIAKIRVLFRYGSETDTLKWNPQEKAFIGSVMVTEGTKPTRTSAEYDGYLNIQDTGLIRALDNCSPRAFAVRVQSGGSDIKTWDADVRDLDRKDLPPLVILPEVNGAPLNREELKNYQCTVEGPSRLSFQVTHLPNGQGWELRPEHFLCTSCFTRTGDFPLLITLDGKGPASDAANPGKAVRVSIRSKNSVNPQDTINVPKGASVRINDPGLLRRCWWLLLATIAAIYGLGVWRKPRFARSSVVEYARSGSYAGKQTESLAGSFFERYIFPPYAPQTRTIEGVTFKAGSRDDYVLITKECQTDQMLVGGSKLDRPGNNDAWLNDKESVELKGSNRTETYRYLA